MYLIRLEIMKEFLYSKQRFSIKTKIEAGKLWPRVRSGSQPGFTEIYWNSAFTHHLELSDCDRNHMTGKVEIIYYSARYKKSLLTFTPQWVIFLPLSGSGYFLSSFWKTVPCPLHGRTLLNGTSLWSTESYHGVVKRPLSHWGLNLSSRWHMLLPVSLHPWSKGCGHAWAQVARGAPPHVPRKAVLMWTAVTAAERPGPGKLSGTVEEGFELRNYFFFLADLKTRDLHSGHSSMGEALKSEKVSVVSHAASHSADNSLSSVYVILPDCQ